MKELKKLILVFGVFILGIVIASNASAIVASQEGQLGVRAQTAAQNSGTTTTLRNALQTAVTGAIDRCPMIESRIQVKVGDFDNNKIRHMEAYANMKERLAKVDARLSEKGVDTTELKSYLVVLDEKIKKFSADYAIYVGKLKDTQTAVCGKPKTQFLAKLKEAKVALKAVHQDALDIRTYYVSTIKPELQALKAQLNDSKATSSEDVVTTTKNEAPAVAPEATQSVDPSTGIIE